MVRTPSWLCTGALALLLAGCAAGGNTPGLVSAHHPSAVDAISPSAGFSSIADHGTPGLDYDPTLITVSYDRWAELPSAVEAVQLPIGLRAADQPNAILRKNRRFEQVTDAIAARYGLRIYQQAYVGRCNVAGFVLPDRADGRQVLAALKRDFAGVVDYADFSHLSHPLFEPDDPDYAASTDSSGPQWHLKKIGCAEAWDYTRGDPAVRIAVVDSGVRITHEELSSHVLDPLVYFPDETLDLANNDNTMEDNFGHGTNIAGFVAAEGDNGRTIVGVAHECEVIPVKVYDPDAGPSLYLISGILLATELGAKVISLSYGSYTYLTPLNNAIDEAYDNGVLVVSAGGNDQTTVACYPAAYEHALGVGATGRGDGRSSFSNYGTYVELAAPGQQYKTTDIDSDSDYENPVQGTSFSAPIVAACAALLFSYKPELTVDQVRELLIATGAPTTGFGREVPRVDIGAALAAADSVWLKAPEPARLVHSGIVSLTPTVIGTPSQVDVTLNGAAAGSLSAPPWEFAIDTTSLNFGLGEISFSAQPDSGFSTDSVTLVIDNTAGTFPLKEDFESATPQLAGLDVKRYALPFLEQIKHNTSFWTQTDVLQGGPGAWGLSLDSPHGGGACYYFGTAEEDYGGYEIDALVTPLLDLTGIAAPSLVFYQHLNIEDGGVGYDRGWVYATADFGQTFTPATLREGGDAYFSGYVADWTKAEVDLTPFAGQLVHLALVFESDPLKTYEEEGQPSGWWIDDLTVARNYQETLAYVADPTPAAYSVFGAIPGLSRIDLAVGEQQSVARVEYTLDCAPLGVSGAEDLSVSADPPFTATLQLHAPPLPNQLAELIVQPYAEGDVPGDPLVVPLFIYNQIADTNGDGLVGEGDLDGFPAVVGLASTDEGFIPFYDTDLDGLITELDAAWVGYLWGETLN